MFEPGDEISFHYPRTTHVRYYQRCGYRLRNVRVESIRDLVREPLTPDEFCRRPFVLRSRWLVRGFDLDRKRERQFYLGASQEFAAPSELRVALYDPVRGWPAYSLYRGILPSLDDRKFLSKVLTLWRCRDFGDNVLRVYADDMRLVS